MYYNFNGPSFDSLFLRDSSVCQKIGKFKANKVGLLPFGAIFQGLKRRKFPDVIRTNRQTDRQTENSLL